MVFLSGHSPGATESHRICQAWFLSATLQLEMGHMMMLTHRWLPAAWEGLNDALPKCRELRKGKLKPDVAASPSTILDQLETHLEHLTPWVRGTGPGTYKALESCLCHKQKRSTTKKFWRPEEIVKSFAHLTRPPYHCLAKWPTGVLQYIAWRIMHHYLDIISPDVACPGKACKEHFKTRNIFEQREQPILLHQTAKG